MLALLLACADAPDSEEEPVETCASSDPIAASFATSWCAPCHAAALSGEHRHGAPEGVDLDTPVGVRATSAAVRSAVAEGRMPPGGGPSDAEVARFLAWLDCGAPGQDPAFPAASAAERAVRGAWEVENGTSVEADFPEGITVTVGGIGVGTTSMFGTRSVERYLVTDTEAWLVSRARWDDAGEALFEDTWEPPLQVMAETDAWVSATTRTREVADGTTVAVAEEWTFTRTPAPDLDPRMYFDDREVELSGAEAGGATYTWELSAERGVEARRFAEEGQLVDPEGAVFEVRRINAGPSPDPLPAFLLAAGHGRDSYLLLWDRP